MKLIYRVTLFFILGIIVYSCSKEDTEFKSFLNNKEVVYPGRMAKVSVLPGKNRVGFSFNPSPDPSVTKYIVYWNNMRDSIAVNATSHNTNDLIKVVIPNLNEYTYSFTIYSFDKNGNKSIPLEVNNVKVYGSIYEARLLNRAFNGSSPYVLDDNTGRLTLNFGSPDTINIATTIKYVNKAGRSVEKQLLSNESSIQLDDFKPGTEIQYRSSYIPAQGSLDTFYVANYENFPHVYSYVECDKSLFKAVQLPNDAQPWDSGASYEKLWDGSVGPQGWGNVFHTNGGDYMPVHFTIDLGRVYNNLGRLEETGRDCCHNPDNFEVWGRADLNGAATTLKGNDGGWKDESIAKGWVLLKEVVRTDDGKAPFKVNLMENPPPVRYIRIRVKHNSNNEGWYTNMSELTFWNKQ
ncbi:DUF4998 domain-containing protein [Desertivirga arenae]|uniref:DUF4998 domain-containing protein n=1 Tax=Desertivirga arenae TaxID=2810309 RepID=UPI001A966A17|nr:DUF4998 domain-containing protein [Pedobacter sp. SYSU D00823]